jgi:3-hydroxyisobutyrate dehydrogenase-like beta-hydroxyacid dehydrogenase
MSHSESTAATGIIGMGLMGGALMRMTGARCGWDVDATRCVNAVVADDVFGPCAIVFLCLPNSDIVRSVLRSAKLRTGQIIIDTSTGDPGEMAALGAELAAQGVHYLDATVSGSSAQLLQRDVLVMAGGDAAVFERCRDLFMKFAREAVHVGPCGSGAKMKLVTNLVLGLNRAALAEGLAFAQQLDLDLTQVLDVMRRSMAYSRIMDTKGEKMITQDFTPQAKLSQHLKDVRLMLAVSAIPLPLSETHRQLLEKAEALGFGDADNSAVIKAITPRSGTCQVPGHDAGLGKSPSLASQR